MTRCTECETVEGEFRVVESWDKLCDTYREVYYCCECGAEDSLEKIPEHDDYDMER